MSLLSSLASNSEFERFNFTDIFRKVKDEPLSLLGGMTPVGAAFWKKIGVLDDDFEPPLNILGGPFGGAGGLGGDGGFGRFAGLGDEGGVFGRFQDKGGDPEVAAGAHNIAEIIAISKMLNAGSDSAGLTGEGGLLGSTGMSGTDVFQLGQGLLGGGQQQPNNAAHQMALERERQRRASLQGFRL